MGNNGRIKASSGARSRVSPAFTYFDIMESYCQFLSSAIAIMKFTEILYGSDLYAKELDLRNDVLRIPLRLSLYEEDLSGERGSRHFGILEDNDLLACAVLESNGDGRVRLRQMAVSEGARGLGVGSRLVGELERLAKDEGIREVVLSARVSAAGFYESLGYVRFGDEFLSVTIPHINMRKNI